MTETQPEGLLERIDARIAALASAEKHLKKPSTLSFVERRDLSNKAARAGADLKARRQEVQEAEGVDTSAEDEALPEPIQAALKEADRVLGMIEAAQPAGFNRRTAGAASTLHGQQRRGTGGMNMQQRPPDRIGGE